MSTWTACFIPPGHPDHHMQCHEGCLWSVGGTQHVAEPLLSEPSFLFLPSSLTLAPLCCLLFPLNISRWDPREHSSGPLLMVGHLFLPPLGSWFVVVRSRGAWWSAVRGWRAVSAPQPGCSWERRFSSESWPQYHLCPWQAFGYNFSSRRAPRWARMWA